MPRSILLTWDADSLTAAPTAAWLSPRSIRARRSSPPRSQSRDLALSVPKSEARSLAGMTASLPSHLIAGLSGRERPGATNRSVSTVPVAPSERLTAAACAPDARYVRRLTHVLTAAADSCLYRTNLTRPALHLPIPCVRRTDSPPMANRGGVSRDRPARMCARRKMARASERPGGLRRGGLRPSACGKAPRAGPAAGE